MNGRVYDPVVGRFTSADPMISDTEPSQGANRYSYVLNNPLAFTDPTGLKEEVANTTETPPKGTAAETKCSPGMGGCTIVFMNEIQVLGRALNGIQQRFDTLNKSTPKTQAEWAERDKALQGLLAENEVVHAALGRSTNETTLGRDITWQILIAKAQTGEISGKTMVAGLMVLGMRGGLMGHDGESNAGGRGTGQARAGLWTRAEFRGTRVYQRSDLIDPALLDARGRSNLQRMEKGLAPLGSDGKTINLHHMLQTADSPLAEMKATFHQQNSRAIHINPNTTPSGIDRAAFDSFRRDYWINRAKDFLP